MGKLKSVKEVSQLIESGLNLILSGDESLISNLPKGNWIGGTSTLFMTDEGGLSDSSLIHTVVLPDYITDLSIKFYDEKTISQLANDYKDNGVSFIIMPAFSDVHQVYAKDSTTWRGIFNSPLIGWISTTLNDRSAKVINGATGELTDKKAVVLRVTLPSDLYGKVHTINLFQQGSGDKIEFYETNLEVTDCLINGEKKNFSEYLLLNEIDIKLPIVASFLGTNINVSIKNIDHQNKVVSFYAPVFESIDYRLAIPVDDYEAEFSKLIDNKVHNPLFSCNCYLNYEYANLAGKKTAPFVGPMTFGEIAYMLLNQTLVYLTIEKKTE